MSRTIHRLVAVSLLCGGLSLPAHACNWRVRADVPLAVVHGAFLLTLEVNSLPATFQLDTGAARSLVTPQAVRRLGLALDRWVSASVQGTGGIERHSVADPLSLTLAGVSLHHRDPFRDSSLVVASLGPGEPPAEIDGLLGRDFLSEFAVELDGPSARLRLWTAQGCTRAAPNWGAPFETINAVRAYGDALVIPVQANGVGLRALPDTGASKTLIAAPGMAKLGLKEPASEVALAQGVGRFTRPIWPVTLATLRVGDEVVRDVPALGSRLHLLPIVDLALGADWFRSQDVWLSYESREIFLRSSHGQ